MRGKNGEDRRKIKIKLTDKAYSMLDKVIPKTFDYFIKVMSNFTSNEKELLSNLLINFESQIESSDNE